MILRIIGFLALLYLAFFFGTKYRDGDVRDYKKIAQRAEREAEKCVEACRR